MDRTRFHDLVRALDQRRSRRDLVSLISGALGLLAWRDGDTVTAKKRGRKQQRRHGASGQGLTAESRPAGVFIKTVRDGLSGTFTATGAIQDAGALTVPFPDFHASGAPTFNIVSAVHEFAGAHGTFTMRLQFKSTLGTDPGTREIAGTWVIQGGTGAYERLRGQGRVTGNIDENVVPFHFEFDFTGTAHYH
jgi:hypothetical protein